ncbi:MAG: cobyric acid synthase [Halanaerobiales bacterium]|nr:cobyric acid synthase [Halanaerobiales bacterium]MCF8009058.1 cobyric acid synthase [Halanaerobiales bacterium]
MSKKIMIQGTASNVGKSIFATALLRILYNKGYKVAPFKSWNMALNSFVTKQGGEVGRAQALQAEASGIDITVDMQPFLVKPKGNNKSQVIVRGKPLGDFKAEEQKDDYINWALSIINSSLKKLDDQYDVVVIEGAGSPAEINIKDRDLANMKVARLSNSPVILVADIDKGGAFASLVGTLKLLGKDRKYVKGIIINKFRGKKESLKTGLNFLENKTKVPVVGVIPYLKDLNLPEEDSVTIKEYKKKKAKVNIGIIKLPHLSNFTDFDSLGMESEVNIDYLDSLDKDLKGYDLIIIPGTKNTTYDLQFLKETGLDKKIIEAAKNKVQVVGICGGYQILGKKLIDKDLNEGNLREIKGLSLLDISTVFKKDKKTYQVKAKVNGKPFDFINSKNYKLTGYEIHMGETVLGKNVFPLFKITSRSKKECNIIDGARAKELNVWGTYIHGIFDNDDFRSDFLNSFKKEKYKEIDIKRSKGFKEERIKSLDRLAKEVEKNIDLDLLFNIMGI